MMIDFGEYVAVDGTAQLSSGNVSPRDFHNKYPTEWARLHRMPIYLDE